METITYAPIWTEKRWTGDGWGANPRLLKQLKRLGDVVLVEVRAEKTGQVTGYEVVKISRHEAYEIEGQVVPAAESYPGCAFGRGQSGRETRLESAVFSTILTVLSSSIITGLPRLPRNDCSGGRGGTPVLLNHPTNLASERSVPRTGLRWQVQTIPSPWLDQ